MGCGNSAEDRPIISIEQQFAEAQLNYLLTGSFETDLERHIFMAINVCRYNPAMFIPIVKQVKHNNLAAKQAPFTMNLEKTMRQMGRLPPVKMDEFAFQACRKNNDAIIARNQDVPTEGGNIVVYQQIVAQPINCEEYTMYKYELSTAEQFVALQLILDWGRRGPIQTQHVHSSPILKKDVTAIGVSVKAHRQLTNLIQVLYVKSGAAVLAQPVVLEQPRVVVQQPPIMQQPIQQQIVVMDRPMVLGNLRLHLKEAHLQHDDAGFLQRMSPFVIVKLNGREQRSAVVEGGGRNPRWFEQFFDFEVSNLEHELYVEVRDKDPYVTEMIGYATVRVNFFAVAGERQEWIELFFRGYPAGRIHFKSHYDLQAAITQPIMRQPEVFVEQPRPIVTQPVFQQPIIEGPTLLGNLKLHLKEAHLQHNDAGYLERMSPFVLLRANGREWRSAVCFNGGRRPHWELQFFDFEVANMEHEILIEVRDQDLMMTEPIGAATIRVGFFAVPGGRTEWIELFYMGYPAGKIHFKSEFRPQAVFVTPIIQPEIVRQPVVEQVMFQQNGMRQGLLKLHTIEAHIQHEGEFMRRKNSFVFMKVNFQEWYSQICEGGGRDPKWFEQFMEVPVSNLMDEVFIEVRLRDMAGDESAGEVRLNLNLFCVPGGFRDWFNLSKNGRPHGKILLRSEYFPERF